MIFGQAYGIEAVALRLFNVFGPGQALSNPYTGVLANFAARLANGNRPMVFEDGRQRRDFVHVRDVARAFCDALEAPRVHGHVINVGSGESYSIAEIASTDTHFPVSVLRAFASRLATSMYTRSPGRLTTCRP